MVDFSPLRSLRVQQVQPFTYRDGITFLELLERLSTHVKQVLEPSLKNVVDDLVEQFTVEMGEHRDSYVEGVEEFQRIHDAFMADVEANVREINEGAVTSMVSDSTGQLGTVLRNIFAQTNDVAALMSENSTEDRAYTDTKISEVTQTVATNSTEDRAYTDTKFSEVTQTVATTVRYSNALTQGVTGDGVADDTDALEHSVNDARNYGQVLALPRNGKIVVSRPIDISGVDIEGNNAEIVIHTPFGGYALSSTGSFNQRITNLSVVLDARSAAPPVQNMVLFDDVENLVLDNVNIRSTTPGANSSNHGVFGNHYAALAITNSKKTYVTNLTTQNFENHVRLDTNTLMTFQNITIDTYRLGIWLRDSTQTVFNNVEIFGASPHASKLPGENGVLIEATEHGAVDHATFSDVFVRDAGEHGYRIGGSRQVRNVTYNDCTAHTVGACGFKTLGDSTEEGDAGNRHTGITYNRCTVIDGGLSETNHNGFDVVLADNVHIIHPVIRRENTSYSTSNGVYVAGANDVTIINPLIENFMYSGIRFEMATRFRELRNITVDGGTFRVVDGHTVDRQGIMVSGQRAPAAGSRFNNITVKNNPSFDLIAGVYAYTVMIDTAASAGGVRLFTGLIQASAQPLHPDSENPQHFRFQMIGSRVRMSDDLPIGATWYDTELGQQNPLYIRRNTGWEQLT